MSRLTDLIRDAKRKDAQLGKELEAEFRALSERRQFGLNFERHRPEAVELPGRPVRPDDLVRILPPRGQVKKGDQVLWQVDRIQRVDGTRVAHLSLPDAAEPLRQVQVCDDLVVVSPFHEPIYPGLLETGWVNHGGDAPAHTVINGENFHALKALTYTHRHKIDAIYIDPPYNTGARDWKYNNDYVDSDDDYRHSKWLAFMERRLKVVEELLNPKDSVLIVTIDEKEYLRLGLLLEQMFSDSDARIQMVTSVVNPGGTTKSGGFARVEEYIYFVFFGGSAISKSNDDMLWSEEKPTHLKPVIWQTLIRTGSGSKRHERPSQFYPIFIEPASRTVAHIGPPLPRDMDRDSVEVPNGLEGAWPLRSDGSEGNWRMVGPSLQKLLDQGYAQVGTKNKRSGQWAVKYIFPGDIQRIQDGTVLVTGRDSRGVYQLENSTHRDVDPKLVWRKSSHDGGKYGSNTLRALIPGHSFPYPKSLYAVEDTLRFFVKNKPEAVILDFFSGSGTTAHAVMRLNKQDNGRRQCISVTNNEVEDKEAKKLRREGLRPGDTDWEKWGICDYITKPRIQAAITGQTPAGDAVKGEYKFADEFPMSEGFAANARFFTLTYHRRTPVVHGFEFKAIAPLLWLRAGAVGEVIDKVPAANWAVSDVYAVLFKLDRTDEFLAAIEAADDVRIAYIITDDEGPYQSIVRRLPDGVEPVRLYETYLDNFRILNGEV